MTVDGKMQTSHDQVEEIRERIADHIAGLDLTEYPATWSDLDLLSKQTRQDAIEVDPNDVKVSGDDFSGMMNVYVVLQYGRGSDGFTTSEGFPGKFEGHIDDDRNVVIDSITVDTRSFYE